MQMFGLMATRFTVGTEMQMVEELLFMSPNPSKAIKWAERSLVSNANASKSCLRGEPYSLSISTALRGSLRKIQLPGSII